MRMKQVDADLQVIKIQEDRWEMRRSATDPDDKNEGKELHQCQDREAGRLMSIDHGHLGHRIDNKIHWPGQTLIPKRMIKQLENFCRKWLAT